MKVTMLMAMTVDGKIGKDSNHFPDWTGKSDKKLFVEISRQAGVIIMGSKTFDTINAPLKDRKIIVLTRNADRISQWDSVVFSRQHPRDVLNQLKNQGYSQVILAGGALINSLFAEENLIDEIIITISPLIFGHGLSLFSENIAMELELVQVKALDDRVVCLKYNVKK